MLECSRSLSHQVEARQRWESSRQLLSRKLPWLLECAPQVKCWQMASKIQGHKQPALLNQRRRLTAEVALAPITSREPIASETVDSVTCTTRAATKVAAAEAVVERTLLLPRRTVQNHLMKLKQPSFKMKVCSNSLKSILNAQKLSRPKH